ncbi:MAG TPA: sigma 54-interacting transcriptional regulator, partial [Thermoanaerobaculia bacterium]
MPNDSEALRWLLQTDTQAESAGASPAGPVYVPGLTVLYHPDAERTGERIALPGLSSGRREALARGEPAFSQPGSALLRPLADPYLSRRPIQLLPGAEPGGVRLSCGESGTAVTVDGETAQGDLEIPPVRLERGAVLLLAGRVVLLLSQLDPVGVAGAPDFGLVGESAPMLALRREIQRVAGLDVPVLLRGETGTGKELVARALHDAGPRRNCPYVAVNMAAIPASLAAAEL